MSFPARVKHLSDACDSQSQEGGAIPTGALHLDFCSYALAQEALRRYHYNPKRPHGRTCWIGVWYGNVFYGCVIAGNGAAPHRGRRYGLCDQGVTEITRIALRRDHPFSVSRVLRIALLLIKERFPETKLCLSYADAAQRHVGTIYQAAGWIYLGAIVRSYIRVHGEVVHPKTLHNRYGKGGQAISWLRAHVDPSACYVKQAPKYKYAKSLDPALTSLLSAQRLPYPKGIKP